MTTLNRRRFLQLAGAAAGTGLAPSILRAGNGAKARVVVVGGGYGGTVAAKYLRRMDPGIQVTLVEPKRSYVSCPFSNLVIAGVRDLPSITFGYEGLAQHGIQVVHDRVTGVDPQRSRLRLAGGGSLDYDRLVLSPGTDFRWDSIEGYGPEAAERMPHAWEAGPQTLRLRDQLRAMPDGGTVFIACPRNPFRCPPGPYERASLMAWYLSRNKPRSKVVMLDAKDAFSKQALFRQGWEKHYPGKVEWVPAAADGRVEAVDPKRMVLRTTFEEHQADVACVIPDQKAGALADLAEVTDESGWCPVNPRTFESTLQAGIHVVGDACIAGAMPKSGYAANSQAKVAAAAIAALVNGEEPGAPAYVNTCYSLIAPDHGISVAAVYEHTDGGIRGVQGAGGVSELHVPPSVRRREARYARGWFNAITQDMFT